MHTANTREFMRLRADDGLSKIVRLNRYKRD